MEDIYKLECIERKNYKKYIFSDDQKELVKHLYLNGNSTVQIGKMFGTSHKVVAKILKQLGIDRTGVGIRKYKLNENYFDEIDTQNKAYILGFLYADGHNEIPKRTVQMSLEEHDRSILEKIRKEVGSERELEFIDYSNKHDFGYTYKNQYRLLFFSAHMCDALNDIGMIQNKSLSLKFPNIKGDLVRHFIRGYFDGDGCVCQGQRETNYLVSITSTNDFCLSIKEYVENELGINMHIYNASNKNGITKVITTSGKNQVKKFLDWLYEGADLYLERKYERYIKYFYKNDTYINNALTA